MERPLVSIIIPVFNGELFIGRTLESALAQTYDPLEIVVVDDGSTDQTAIIIEAAALLDNRIRFFRRPHAGVSAARNFAISQSSGSLIAPLDGDDLWHPEKLSQQVHTMQASTLIGLVYCWTVDIDERDFIIPPIRDKCVAQGNVLIELIEKNNFIESGSVPLIRRSCLDAVGGYDPSFRGSEDWKLYLALAEACEFAVVPAHLVGYRRSAISTSNNTAAMAHSIDDVEQWIVEKWLRLPIEVTRRMYSNSNRYLAHKALTANDFVGAARYQLRSIRFEPSSLLSLITLRFGVRFCCHFLGISRSDVPMLRDLVPFKDFQPKFTLIDECDRPPSPEPSMPHVRNPL